MPFALRQVPNLQVPVQAGFAVIGLGVLTFIVTMIRARTVVWNLTSDRLIEKRGVLASRRREMELADIRSIEVDKRVFQRMMGLGDVRSRPRRTPTTSFVSVTLPIPTLSPRQCAGRALNGWRKSR